MNTRSKTTRNLLLLATFSLMLGACDRYTWTVNERVVHNPSSLFQGYSIPDTALTNCIDQVIRDQRITNAPQLTQLNCSHAGVKSLEGLTTFTGLKYLNLSGNALADIKPLLYMPYLDTVDLDNNAELSCADARLLSKQLTGKLQLPTHCIQPNIK